MLRKVCRNTKIKLTLQYEIATVKRLHRYDILVMIYQASKSDSDGTKKIIKSIKFNSVIISWVEISTKKTMQLYLFNFFI